MPSELSIQCVGQIVSDAHHTGSVPCNDSAVSTPARELPEDCDIIATSSLSVACFMYCNQTYHLPADCLTDDQLVFLPDRGEVIAVEGWSKSRLPEAGRIGSIKHQVSLARLATTVETNRTADFRFTWNGVVYTVAMSAVDQALFILLPDGEGTLLYQPCPQGSLPSRFDEVELVCKFGDVAVAIPL